MAKIAAVTLIVALSIATTVRADDPSPAKVLKQFEDGSASGQISEMQKELAAAQQRSDWGRARQLALAIKSERAALASAKKSGPKGHSQELPIPVLRNLKVGSIGRLATAPTKVLQVIDAKSMLVEYGDSPRSNHSSSESGTIEAPEHGSAEAQARLEEFRQAQNAIHRITLMVEIRTASFADGSRINLNDLADCWYVYRTTTYQTVAGSSKTVLVARPYDLAEVRRLWDQKQNGSDLPAEHNAKVANAAKPAGAAVANLHGSDRRTKWLNATYNVTLRPTGDKKWAEFENKSGRLHLNYAETGRTDERIDIFCPERHQEMRVYSEHMDIFKDGRWQWVANGKWVRD